MILVAKGLYLCPIWSTEYDLTYGISKFVYLAGGVLSPDLWNRVLLVATKVSLFDLLFNSIRREAVKDFYCFSSKNLIYFSDCGRCPHVFLLLDM